MTDTKKAQAGEQLKKDQKAKDDELEEELEDSFPASDPPSITQPNGAPGAPDHGGKK